MMRWIFHDLYGCEAYVTEKRNGSVRVVIYRRDGVVFHDKVYKSFRGARIALGRLSDGTMELIRKKEVQS